MSLAHRPAACLFLLVAVSAWLLAADETKNPGQSDSAKPAQPYTPDGKSAWLRVQDMTGSSPESEEAVDAGLAWLAEHQFPVGGWNFDNRLGPCQGRCGNPGTMAKAVNGATGLALLAFIDHGNTHQAGEYRQNVAAGLQFLASQMKSDGSMWEVGGSMYSHAIGLMAICEDLRIGQEASGRSTPFPWQPAASGKKGGAQREAAKPKLKADRLTAQQRKDQQLRDALNRLLPVAASKGLAFMLLAQDRRRGGWRYDPHHPDSDVSVTGWQVVAMHSAAAIDMPIPARTSMSVNVFLNSVQGDNGASYGYRLSAAEATPARSSIGLLCRVYTGAAQQQIERGVEMVAKAGPSENDMYYNYYATLLLHHFGGQHWEQWNGKLRDYLIRTQSHNGHESGSWSFAPCQSNIAGGRHFDTCMALLILETYYRSKPAYAAPQPANVQPVQIKPMQAKPAQAKPTEHPPAKSTGE